jgi:putative hydrolase of the HAD superfamily
MRRPEPLEIEAVFLDVGGVLLVPHPRPMLAALAGAGIHVELREDDVLQAHYLGIRALDDATEPERVRRAYLPAFLARLGLSGAAEEALRPVWKLPAIDLWRLLVPGSIEGLRELAATGRKLAVISNSDGTVEAQLLEHRICQIGEGAGVPVLAIVDSGLLGVAKPDPRIFEHAAGLLGVPLERSVYVGDTRRYDVAGAVAAGVTPIHFDPLELCPERDGHAHVRALAEVVRLI